eukprot:SAG31_NODE_352_length_17229_cov_9.658669_5_plen_146_part_00
MEDEQKVASLPPHAWLVRHVASFDSVSIVAYYFDIIYDQSKALFLFLYSEAVQILVRFLLRPTIHFDIIYDQSTALFLFLYSEAVQILARFLLQASNNTLYRPRAQRDRWWRCVWFLLCRESPGPSFRLWEPDCGAGLCRRCRLL